ncbi:xylan 1,4-beta-xylosidase [Streptomyces malaysiense]|uniref:Xylan 1,4-beta-xylosidase n=1 Tax=Streptomyces malaysiense TaxID=1428626 RepID=A0A1J4PX90_9ACTN|nr:xylan 1,4-beta-xylosidase [Streptomyces malaysiense]OIK25369.1 xylan 1,4-beta-xylosidase [Streptomyces malaysiense]
MARRGWESDGRHRRLGVLLGGIAAALALLVSLLGGLPGTPAAPRGAAKPYAGWGFTHTQFSADEGAPAATARVRRLLEGNGGMAQDQAIMGWGADNPEPSPGRYDFAALDRRIGFVRASGGTPVITLCCAPDWMKGGRSGADNTDWSLPALESAPAPAHYQDFADLAATVARRYPDVHHFLVWNEFKGFWDEAADRWDYEGYTRLYNLVYRALKKTGEDVLVGGPYLAMDSVARTDPHASPRLRGDWGAMDQRVLDAFSYWNAHKAGADFTVVDGASYPHGGTPRPDEFTATDKLTAVSAWVRRQAPGLPLWWAEYYVEPGDGDAGWSEPHRVAVQATGMIALVVGGADTGFYWNPEKRTGPGCPGCLWTPTDRADGGRALPMYDLLSRFATAFPPGTRYRTVPVDPAAAPGLRVLASDRTVLVVNTRDRTIGARVDGGRLTLGPYEVRWLAR